MRCALQLALFSLLINGFPLAPSNLSTMSPLKGNTAKVQTFLGTWRYPALATGRIFTDERISETNSICVILFFRAILFMRFIFIFLFIDYL